MSKKSELVLRSEQLGYASLAELLAAVEGGRTISWGSEPRRPITKILFLRMIETHAVVLLQDERSGLVLIPAQRPAAGARC